MKIPSDQPEVFQKFKPEVMEIDGGTTNNVASLVHHISGTIRNDPFNHVNITKLHRCSSNACSKKEVEAQRQGLVSARLPAAFWKIFRIKNNLDGGKEGNWELQLGSFSFFSRSLNVAFLPFTDMIMGDCLVRDVEKAGEYMLGSLTGYDMMPYILQSCPLPHGRRSICACSLMCLVCVQLKLS